MEGMPLGNGFLINVHPDKEEEWLYDQRQLLHVEVQEEELWRQTRPEGLQRAGLEDLPLPPLPQGRAEEQRNSRNGDQMVAVCGIQRGLRTPRWQLESWTPTVNGVQMKKTEGRLRERREGQEARKSCYRENS